MKYMNMDISLYNNSDTIQYNHMVYMDNNYTFYADGQILIVKDYGDLIYMARKLMIKIQPGS